MKYAFGVILSLLILAAASGAYATVPEGTRLSNAQLAPLAQWVSAATHVKLDVLPLAIVSDQRLGKALRIDDVQRAGAAAAYLPGRLIIGRDVWDPDSIESQSYVVHELVHHAQLVSGRVYPCHAAKEREAYTLQNQWLTEHGRPPLVDQAFIDRMASCAISDNTDND